MAGEDRLAARRDGSNFSMPARLASGPKRWRTPPARDFLVVDDARQIVHVRFYDDHSPTKKRSAKLLPQRCVCASAGVMRAFYMATVA